MAIPNYNTPIMPPTVVPQPYHPSPYPQPAPALAHAATSSGALLDSAVTLEAGCPSPIPGPPVYPCPPQQHWNEDKQQCVPNETPVRICPTGMHYDDSMAGCVYDSGAEGCPNGTHETADGAGCIANASQTCPPGWRYVSSLGGCVMDSPTGICPLGMVYSPAYHGCVYLMVPDGCGASCPSGTSTIQGTMTCCRNTSVACPPGWRYNEESDGCVFDPPRGGGVFPPVASPPYISLPLPAPPLPPSLLPPSMLPQLPPTVLPPRPPFPGMPGFPGAPYPPVTPYPPYPSVPGYPATPATCPPGFWFNPQVQACVPLFPSPMAQQEATSQL